jgi:hypothetical protein
MFAKISLAAAFFLMMGAPFAGASENARPIERSALRTSISIHESGSIVVAQDAQSNDSADSDNDSSDSSDDNDNDSGDTEQSAGADQSDQPAIGVQGFRAPDSDASDAGQVPLNAYPQQQVNPYQ